MRVRFDQPTNKLLIFLAFLIIGLQAAILWDFGQKIDILWGQNSASASLNNLNSPAGFPLKVYIQNAIKGLYSYQPAVDPLAKKVYLPEANIYLPLNNLSRKLVYSYQPPDQSQNQLPVVQVDTSTNINRLIGSFADVPCAQRLAALSINKVDQELSGIYGKSDGKLVLADGRTLYFYESTAANCTGFWQDDPQTVIDLLRQSQSY